MSKSTDSKRAGRRQILYFVMLAISLGVQALIVKIGHTDRIIHILGNDMQISSLAGVVSTLGSLCALYMTITMKKKGFITALALLLLQLSILLVGLFFGRNPTALAGIFSVALMTLAVVFIYQRGKKIDRYQTVEMDALKARQKGAELLFEQTATALVNAIEAKDVYSRGHSLRVAEYSRRIAKQLGKSEEECNQIYYAGLLHDVGKIGIKYSLLNKQGKLTNEEYEAVKQHAVIGKQILSGITAYPYLSIAANSHHERYDGKGYPDKWKGNDIPEIARIISVADAYDAMTSNRSYRNAMPQQLVREEIVKGAGTQFDPEIARAMQHLIDIDTDYEMKERKEVKELAGKNELVCTDYRSEISEGILVTNFFTRISLRSTPMEGPSEGARVPSIILFDSLDGRVHDEEKTVRDLNYFEYAEICFDGRVVTSGARIAETETVAHAAANQPGSGVYKLGIARFKDHVLIEIDDGAKTVRATIALPDSTRYAYIALTGEYCHLKDVSIDATKEELTEDRVKRIAPEISYIEGPEGDIPNVQVDGFRTDTTRGIPVTDGLQIHFHTMSLPTARLIWHCPFISIFTSDDGMIEGPHFREFALVRLDGETWEDKDDGIVNDLTVNRQPDFVGWDAWKEKNKQGYDCVVSFERKGNEISLITENFGVYIRNTTHVASGKRVFAAITGDQCALTDIRINTNP
ncbi:MAG: HD-GYP domain-containing protein [Clostridia bacterium]|nr:HD-GYP domain-containing protein [Clostridia bacterium]